MLWGPMSTRTGAADGGFRGGEQLGEVVLAREKRREPYGRAAGAALEPLTCSRNVVS